uniref:Alcohol dehydrogenase, iron-containing n=1 Tax=Chlorobium chlorochromatii (strain CaD3) TaxID=340177 RepID=Q3AS72_CHLCH
MPSIPFSPFITLPLPELYCGAGTVKHLPELAARFGRTVLLITGKRALQQSGRLMALQAAMQQGGLKLFHEVIEREPSPEIVNRVVAEYRQYGVEVVVAIGGGSVLDGGKAISGMLCYHEPVERFIEGLPNMVPFDGRKVPFIAVPTTAGTGSEVTNNAVISRVGDNGFKRSLRHRALVPNIAVVDPELMVGTPASLTIASGMDACTQLLEAYTSPFATPYTDAVALSGLNHFSRSFVAACGSGTNDVAVRGDVAYAACMSGVALANAGLGVVHGFASSVGGLIDIPHGVLCATLLYEATRENIEALRQLESNHPQLQKFSCAGSIMVRGVGMEVSSAPSIEEGCELLLALLEHWQERFNFARLQNYGLQLHHIPVLVQATRTKSNAVALSSTAMERILHNRL